MREGDMMNRIWPSLFLIGSVLLWATGCSSTSDRLKGLSADVSELKVSETSATLTVRYINETVVPIALSGSKHKLHLDGKYVGEIVSDKPVGVQKLSAVTLQIPLSDAKVIARLRELQPSGSVRYHLESTLHILAGDDKLTAPSKAEGVVEVSR